VDFKRATAGLDPETTLVVIVSKTFTTAETMLNARTMRAWLLENIKGADSEAICRQHIVACSSALSKTSDFGIDPANVFGFWDWVGGRFSIHSAVGMVCTSLNLRTLVPIEYVVARHVEIFSFAFASLQINYSLHYFHSTIFFSSL
jgi:glucose-6-phosphate isomerase